MAYPTTKQTPTQPVNGQPNDGDPVAEAMGVVEVLQDTVGYTGDTAAASGSHEARIKYLALAAGTATALPTVTWGTATSAGTAATRLRTDATFAVFATPALTFGTANAMGTATTWMRRDATLAIFTPTVPATQDYGNTASAGTAAFAARNDHQHGMPSFARTFMLIGV